jgi:hypothetical protein
LDVKGDWLRPLIPKANRPALDRLVAFPFRPEPEIYRTFLKGEQGRKAYRQCKGNRYGEKGAPSD